MFCFKYEIKIVYLYRLHEQRKLNIVFTTIGTSYLREILKASTSHYFYLVFSAK